MSSIIHVVDNSVLNIVWISLSGGCTQFVTERAEKTLHGNHTLLNALDSLLNVIGHRLRVGRHSVPQEGCVPSVEKNPQPETFVFVIILFL